MGSRLYFVLFFICNICSYVEIKTDSYDMIEKICSEHPNCLLVIDLFDVGIEYKNTLLHKENRQIVNKILKQELQEQYRIKAYVDAMEAEGFVEIPEFVSFYEKIIAKQDVLCLSFKLGYSSEYVFQSLRCVESWDSYRNGVLFCKNAFFEKLLKFLSEKYSFIVFVTASLGVLKKITTIMRSLDLPFIAILFAVKREPKKFSTISFD